MNQKWAKTCAKTLCYFTKLLRSLSLSLSLSVSLHCASKRDWRARPEAHFVKWQTPLDSLITRPHLCFLVFGVSIDRGEFVAEGLHEPPEVPARYSTTSSLFSVHNHTLPRTARSSLIRQWPTANFCLFSLFELGQRWIAGQQSASAQPDSERFHQTGERDVLRSENDQLATDLLVERWVVFFKALHRGSSSRCFPLGNRLH